jgi:HAD superfamily hydrolase (TIGR01509 family)
VPAAPPRPPFRPQGVVFDLDGLLVDSEDAWGVAERRVVLDYGKPWDPSVRTLLLGRGPREAAQVLAAHVGAADPREVERRVLQAAVAEFKHGIAARPGARELAEALEGRVPIGVATNSRRVLAELSLSGAGFDWLVPGLVCAEDVTAPKPAPDPYLLACRRLGVDPARGVGLEDSPLGVMSAQAAGLWVIGCPSLPEASLEAADAVVTSLTEVDADVLLGQRPGP